MSHKTCGGKYHYTATISIRMIYVLLFEIISYSDSLNELCPCPQKGLGILRLVGVVKHGQTNDWLPSNHIVLNQY